jgi:hypothetical protein
MSHFESKPAGRMPAAYPALNSIIATFISS